MLSGLCHTDSGAQLSGHGTYPWVVNDRKFVVNSRQTMALTGQTTKTVIKSHGQSCCRMAGSQA
ncbi:MAG: hypothetical protein EBQ82_01240 [Betaproteobacteria bacterium]|nr:hypothetical protein [Betaproteobacteria bacterium]NBY04038.1 hypothetical protein [Betaproteobacteria bacterium]